jgi:hypothetical protein
VEYTRRGINIYRILMETSKARYFLTYTDIGDKLVVKHVLGCGMQSFEHDGDLWGLQ